MSQQVVVGKMMQNKQKRPNVFNRSSMWKKLINLKAYAKFSRISFFGGGIRHGRSLHKKTAKAIVLEVLLGRDEING